jgi:hypothetical protein
MQANNIRNSLDICRLIPAINNSKRARQYALGVTEGYPDSLIANIKT